MLIRHDLLQVESLKTFGIELDKIGATSPSDRRRYLDAILVSLEQRGHKMVNRGFKK
jgi:recombinational DNA repair ATPase RecF